MSVAGYSEVAPLSEGTEARLIITKESIARCLATRFCLTPKQYGRYKPWKDLLSLLLIPRRQRLSFHLKHSRRSRFPIKPQENPSLEVLY